MKKSAKSSWSSSSSSTPQQHSQKHLPLFVVFYSYTISGLLKGVLRDIAFGENGMMVKLLSGLLL